MSVIYTGKPLLNINTHSQCGSYCVIVWYRMSLWNSYFIFVSFRFTWNCSLTKYYIYPDNITFLTWMLCVFCVFIKRILVLGIHCLITWPTFVTDKTDWNYFVYGHKMIICVIFQHIWLSRSKYEVVKSVSYNSVCYFVTSMTRLPFAQVHNSNTFRKGI